MLQQGHPVGGVAGVHGGYIDGLQRVGQQAHADPLAGALRQVVETAVGRHEIGGNQDQLAGDRLEQRHQLGSQLLLRLLVALVQHLQGRIPDRFGAGPGQRVQPVLQMRLVVLLGQTGDELRLADLFQVEPGLQIPAEVRQLARIGFAPEVVFYRPADGAVPVLVEALPQLPGDRPDAEQVEVAEVHLGLGVEVLVAKIASADDGQAVVRQPQLVVHAPVLPGQVEQAAEIAREAGAAAEMLRVEQAHLDIRMGCQRTQLIVTAVAADVVEQHAHAHTTIRRTQHFVDQRAGGEAVVHDVVLDIQAALGLAH
ncbi:hypothetical protein D3C78_675440 [compost metagenome]